ncbi:MAG: potassium channel protein [Okeania sp. SIO2C9]|uniref:ion transporter n=1 Tax=Okeania sp. SIO2C9 TaxID=2607791 RepID=UPI0013C239CF|nr:ion transporter [Okeania sp. SIO2C9]NEQ76653.1 potassium channel protein [Okeania sp. SIO2C9]
MTNSNSSLLSLLKKHNYQPYLQRFLQLPIVNITIGIIIILSVILTIVELSIPEKSPYLLICNILSQIFTILFVIELSFRFLVAPNKKAYFQEYWLDILAILPLLRVFRTIRALRLLRLLRIFRLPVFFNRYGSTFPYILQRGIKEYLIVIGLLLLTIMFGTVAILVFESSNNPNFTSLEEGFWFSVYSLFAGEPIPAQPSSLGGKIVGVFVIFMNVTIFAMFTGTVSAFMVDKIRREDDIVDWESFSNHTIICGWNRKAEIIVREFKAAGKSEGIPIIVIAEFDDEPNFMAPDLKSRIQFLKDDFTKVTALEKAGIRRAETCIILCDKTHGRSDQDADARTILAALTAEKLNPNVYTCAELLNREYGSHLDMGHVNDYIVSQEQSGFLLAQAALNKGLMGVFSELLTYERGNQFYRITITAEWVGKTFLDLFIYIKQNHNAILIAVSQPQGKFEINPQRYIFQDKDNLIVIAAKEIKL